MGLLGTILKTAVTWDSTYVKRYELAGKVQGAILELCRSDGFKAYLTSGGKETKIIGVDTDLTVDSLHSFSLEIDLKNGIKNLYLGMGSSESPIWKKFRAGLISEEQRNLHYRSWPIHRYETSFDGYRDIKSRMNQMLELQASDSKTVESSEPFHICPSCSQKINAPKFRTTNITCPACSYSWTSKP